MEWLILNTALVCRLYNIYEAARIVSENPHMAKITCLTQEPWVWIERIESQLLHVEPWQTQPQEISETIEKIEELLRAELDEKLAEEVITSLLSPNQTPNV